MEGDSGSQGSEDSPQRACGAQGTPRHLPARLCRLCVCSWLFGETERGKMETAQGGGCRAKLRGNMRIVRYFAAGTLVLRAVFFAEHLHGTNSLSVLLSAGRMSSQSGASTSALANTESFLRIMRPHWVSFPEFLVGTNPLLALTWRSGESDVLLRKV